MHIDIHMYIHTRATSHTATHTATHNATHSATHTATHPHTGEGTCLAVSMQGLVYLFHCIAAPTATRTAIHTHI